MVHTLFSKVVGLLVHDTWRPPLGLSLFWVASGTGSGSWWRLPSVVRVSDLLAGLNELDECLGDHTAVELLEVFQGTLIVAHDFLDISHSDGNHIRGCVRRVVVTIRAIIVTRTGDGGARRISAAAANSARGCLHSTTGTRLKAYTLTKDLEEVLADLGSEKSGVFFLNGGGLVNLDLSLAVEVDHSVVGVRQTDR